MVLFVNACMLVQIKTTNLNKQIFKLLNCLHVMLEDERDAF